MQLIKFILGCIVYTVLQGVSAQTSTNGVISEGYCTSSSSATASNGIDVLFLNGISNTEAEAEAARIALLVSISPLNVQYPGLIRVGKIYNPTAGKIVDNLELRQQTRAELIAQEMAASRLKKLLQAFPDLDTTIQERLRLAFFRLYLGETVTNAFLLSQSTSDERVAGSIQSNNDQLTTSPAANVVIGPVVLQLVASIEERILAGRRVVIVAHSQGNFFIQAAFGVLLKRLSSEQMKALQVVGVAVVSTSTPTGKWVTNSKDQAVYTLQAINAENVTGANFLAQPLGSGSIPKGNFDSDDLADSGSMNHGFVDTYMSELIFRKGNKSETLSSTVRSLVSDAIKASVAAPPVITFGAISATLSWVNRAGTDIDLHVVEDFKDGSGITNVYWGNPQGRLGFLDVDDIVGPGPEHYYSNSTMGSNASNLAVADRCAGFVGKNLLFKVDPYTTLGRDEPVVLNIRVGAATFSRSFLLKNSDKEPQADRAAARRNYSTGTPVWRVEFGSNRQFTIIQLR